MMWQELNKCVEKFESLGLDKVMDFDQFNRIAIVHHSSAIEGSTLTREETTLLLTEGITAKGKPMNDHLMVKDHYDALLFILEQVKNKTPVTPEYLRQINARVNKNTGQMRNLPAGTCNDANGDFRLGNVTAGETYFVNDDKVVPMVQQLCEKIRSKINSVKTNEEIYQLSFDAHFYLVSIHPWFDGNGRASRLLMNYIQSFHARPLSIVFLEDKPAYIKALNDSRQHNEIDIFRNFMAGQHIKFLSHEIEKFDQRNKGMSFLF